jgi:F-type H+-transporting ATPase subunit gamma
MANLKVIRRRIHSVQNTQKITRAMKMVSAAKLRRAQDAATSFRGYADLTASILNEVSRDSEDAAHPLLESREVERALIVVISSDRGLCGAFNGNLCRAVEARVKEAEIKPALAIIGRKAADFFGHRDVEIKIRYRGVYDSPGYETARRIATALSELFAIGEVDRIELAFNEFESVMRQTPTIKPLLPVALEQAAETRAAEAAGPAGYTFEPDREHLLGLLLPKYVEVQMYRALLESIAAEHAARMAAMDAATNNAGEMIDHFTLQYNRARQDAITKELMDIVGGAEALGE